MIVALLDLTSGQKVLWLNLEERQIVLPARTTAHTPNTEADEWYSGMEVYMTSFLMLSQDETNLAPPLHC